MLKLILLVIISSLLMISSLGGLVYVLNNSFKNPEHQDSRSSISSSTLNTLEIQGQNIETEYVDKDEINYKLKILYNGNDLLKTSIDNSKTYPILQIFINDSILSFEPLSNFDSESSWNYAQLENIEKTQVFGNTYRKRTQDNSNSIYYFITVVQDNYTEPECWINPENKLCYTNYIKDTQYSGEWITKLLIPKTSSNEEKTLTIVDNLISNLKFSMSYSATYTGNSDYVDGKQQFEKCDNNIPFEGAVHSDYCYTFYLDNSQISNFSDLTKSNIGKIFLIQSSLEETMIGFDMRNQYIMFGDISIKLTQ